MIDGERFGMVRCYSDINPLNWTIMFEDIQEKASELLGNETVKEVVEKATEFINTEKGQEVIETVKEKATEFIKDKLGK